ARARLRRGRGRARGRGVPAGGGGPGQRRHPAGTGRQRGRGGLAAGDRAPVGPAGVPGRVPAGAATGRHAAGHHAEPADVHAAEPADEPVPLPGARPGRAGHAAGGGRLRDHPAARGGGRGPDDRLRARRGQPRRLSRPRRGGGPADTVSGPEGTFCLVLHTHLPWVAHAGAWRRVFTLLDRLAAEGARDVLTLGVTPVLAAMLDDPYCLRELHTWTGSWQLRAVEAAPRLPELAGYEFRAATECLADLEDRWLTGGLSSVLRPLVDAGVVELLGGPATHPFQPLLMERFADAQLSTGLADARLRWGRPVTGIWAPECGYAPGMEHF